MIERIISSVNMITTSNFTKPIKHKFYFLILYFKLLIGPAQLDLKSITAPGYLLVMVYFIDDLATAECVSDVYTRVQQQFWLYGRLTPSWQHLLA